MTFKNSKIDQFLNKIPLESIVMETDAPYLNGSGNQSAYLSLVRNKIAECYKVSADEISRITTQNAKAVFNNHG